jgi:DNA-binding response OmpR family regulator
VRVLVIDDDADLREIIRRALEKAGHAVAEAPNGRAGLDTFRMQPFDAVVTDLIMPEEDGISALLGIRALSETVRLIAISGGGLNRDAGLLAAALKLGANAVLEKPFETHELLAAIADP